MKMKSIIATALFFTTLTGFSQSEDDKRIMADATDAISELKGMDVGLDQFFNNSVGYAVFPNVGEGGFILGAASGNGVVYETGVPVGMTDLKKVDVGFQVGGQAVMEIIFFETDDALNEFKQGDYEFSAELSAIALSSGKSLNASYEDGVVVFVKPKEGLMADVSAGGQRFGYTAMDNLDD